MHTFIRSTQQNHITNKSLSGFFLSILQSYIRPILFIKISVFLIALNVSAQNTTDTTVDIHTQEASSHENIRFAAHLSASYHYPVRHAGYYWEPYFTAGVHMDFPTNIPRLLLHFAVEGGYIGMDEKNAKKKNIKNIVEDTIIAHISVSLSYDIPIYKNMIFIRPRLGLSNTMIEISDFKAREIFSFFAEFENEFGILGGCEPVLRIKRFQFTLPVFAEIMFSSPEPLITGNISLTAGIVF